MGAPCTREARAAIERLGCAHGVYAHVAAYTGVPKTHVGLESVRLRLEQLVRRPAAPGASWGLDTTAHVKVDD